MSKEQWVRKLKGAVEVNAKKLQDLAKPFAVYSKTDPRAKGRLGVRRDFRSDDKDMNKAKNALWKSYEKLTWTNINSIHAEIRANSRYGSSYLEFEHRKDQVTGADLSMNDCLLQKLEQVAECYLRHLELLQECQQKWIEVYESEEENEEWDRAHYSHMLDAIQFLQKKIDKFSADLDACASYLSERELRVPSPNEDLEASLASLNEKYQAGYQSMSSFWRWIKWIKQKFQRSERDLEIQFLTTLSATEGCTDSIRVRAVELVHNKIRDEFFGSGSRLKDILDVLALKRESVEMGDEDELSSFITEHALEMPAELAAYYETMKPQAMVI
ncbi:hypothetical protein Lnau_2440 [Legionella nautarum]|uniref:Uncharacterized protein n=1 Tax=Legionella nautarum TaxID=45070 RepID=A0A0W0WKE6_9GAMM|nr:hypothetical protein [Legionella nautarum]KTD32792.1 hypothetical protein Lnau_2440 [Legionella nautarum]